MLYLEQGYSVLGVYSHFIRGGGAGGGGRD